MLKLTRKVEYSLMALRHMQGKSINSISSTREIANQYNIPVEILAKTLQHMAKVNIIEAINKINTVKFIIFASSMLVCRLGYQPNNSNDYCPDTVYGESKVIGERIVRESSLTVPWTIVRPTSIWGPWFDIPYRSFFDTVHKGLYFHPSGLRVKRSYGFVLNVIYQFL